MQASNDYLKVGNSQKKKNSTIPKEGSKQAKKVHADQKYIVALREHDLQLIEEIYDLHSTMIYRMVKSNSGTEDDGKDVLQDAIMTLIGYASDGFELTCSFKSFLYTICYRRWINTLNKNLKHPTVKVTSINEHHLLKEAEVDFEEIINKINREQFCNRIFNQLGQRCKDYLKSSWIKNGDGKFPSWKEIAEEYGKGYGYIRKKASECRKRLMELARKDPDFDFFKSL